MQTYFTRALSARPQAFLRLYIFGVAEPTDDDHTGSGGSEPANYAARAA